MFSIDVAENQHVFYLPRRFTSGENEKEKKTWAILLIRMLSSYSINLACPYAGETKRGGNVTVVTNVIFASWELTAGTAPWGSIPMYTQDAFFQDPMSLHHPFSSILFAPWFFFFFYHFYFLWKYKKPPTYEQVLFQDFPGSAVVKNPHCNAGDMDLIPGQGTKLPYAAQQLIPHTTATELVHYGTCVPQLESLCTAAR